MTRDSSGPATWAISVQRAIKQQCILRKYSLLEDSLNLGGRKLNG